jgi:hypothetical protein
MLAYNYILLGIMVLGTYMPYKVSQWVFFKLLILLNTYMKFFGKKPENDGNPR